MSIIFDTEEGIRESQNDLWKELSTHERENMLELIGFSMKRSKQEQEWLKYNSESAKTARAISAQVVNSIKEFVKN